ncbi:hypothetical protein ES332_A12G128000v1 [Gossypium tomentosum]|uniref:RlpA-like protein double-psi beta-barrel domain-containing protein n=1 Tax=Gossypium tomentosum TaxID=34277 RepID=A0A5D2MXA9_GOSTO|nr:hypothetical protein ES332_A12G128000v1 [Gossypium tomentosum]
MYNFLPLVSSTGGVGGGPSKCDNQHHSDNDPVEALSTGWYNHGKRYLKYINICGNGKSVRVKVVDKCDSMMRYDFDNSYPNNNVYALKIV